MKSLTYFEKEQSKSKINMISDYQLYGATLRSQLYKEKHFNYPQDPKFYHICF